MLIKSDNDSQLGGREWLALRRTGMKFKMTLTNGKGKRGQDSMESFAE